MISRGPTRFQFTLARILSATALVALLMALCHYAQPSRATLFLVLAHLGIGIVGSLIFCLLIDRRGY